MTRERRHFHRIPFDHSARLMLGDRAVACTLGDLSLKGALLAECAAPLPPGTAVQLVIELDDQGPAGRCIRMQGSVCHREGGHIGIRATAMDLDSIARLRRLVELNLGDPELLERELEALVAVG